MKYKGSSLSIYEAGNQKKCIRSPAIKNHGKPILVSGQQGHAG